MKPEDQPTQPPLPVIRFPAISKSELNGMQDLSRRPKALSIVGFQVKHLLPKKRTSATAASQQRESLRVVQLPNEGIINIRTINVRKHQDRHPNSVDMKQRIAQLRSPKVDVSIDQPAQHKSQPPEPVLRTPVKPEEIMRVFNRMLAAGYGLVSVPAVEYFRAFVDKGNNSVLVKQILKTRPWWNIVTEEDSPQTNLNWTEFRQKALAAPAQPRIPSQSKLQLSKSQVSSLLSTPSTLKALIDLTSVPTPSPSDIGKLLKQFNESARYSLDGRKAQLCNRLPENNQICNKKALFKNLSKWYSQQEKDPFEFIPVTFHVSGVDDEEFQRFMEYAAGLPKKKGLWVVKPGENTNRGNGITVEKGGQAVKDYLLSLKTKHTYIIQSYIRPYLYNQRKFDLRCYALAVMMNGHLKAYWYEQGYIRTASQPFSFKKTDKMIHLTNDAVQKYGQNYGKYEPGNKLSYQQLAKYMMANDKRDFVGEVLPRMRGLCRDIFRAVEGRLGGDRLEDGFEVYGLDYMLDEEMKPWVIEVNTNPCLELSSSLLSRIIPEMLDNAFRIALDPFLMPMERKPQPFRKNRFELIFES